MFHVIRNAIFKMYMEKNQFNSILELHNHILNVIEHLDRRMFDVVNCLSITCENEKDAVNIKVLDNLYESINLTEIMSQLNNENGMLKFDFNNTDVHKQVLFVVKENTQLEQQIKEVLKALRLLNLLN